MQSFPRSAEAPAQAERDVPARRAEPRPTAPASARRLAFGQANTAVNILVPGELNKMCVRGIDLLKDGQIDQPGASCPGQVIENPIAIERFGGGINGHRVPRG
jgi:hypothetical protein